MNSSGRRLVIGLLVFGTSLSYMVLSIARRPRLELGYSTELYALLARSFLLGKATLPIEPRPELLSLSDPYDPKANSNYRLHDASLYKGRYYLYFGAVPAVTLFAPYRLVTGMDLPTRVAVPIFCVGGYLSSCALFFFLARHNRWAFPFWLQCVIILSLGSMSLVCLVLRRPSFYEVAVAAGYFFVMTGFLALAKALVGGGADRKCLLLASLLFSAAVGCRPHLVLICGIVLVAFAIRARRSFRRVIAMTAVMGACGIVLGWYNYARFDNPLEFGLTYQLTNLSHSALPHNVEATCLSAWKFLFVTPHVNTTVPFFHTVFINPTPGRTGPALWSEDMVGLIPAAPFGLLGYFAPLFLTKRLIASGLLDKATAWLLYVMYWSGIVVFFTLCTFGWVIGRFLVEFACLMTFEGASVVAMLWQRLRERPSRYVFSWGATAVAVYGAVVNTALGIPRLDLIRKFLVK